MKTAILAAAFIVATGALASPGAHGPNGEHLEAKAVAASNALARLPDGSVSVPMLALRFELSWRRKPTPRLPSSCPAVS